MRKDPTQMFRAISFLAVLLHAGVATAESKIKAISEDITVVVKSGDNLSVIVERVMGSAEYWEEVATLNKIERPNALKPGQIVVFPSYLVQRRNFARVVFTKGQAELSRAENEDEVAVEKGGRVFLGDVITTGKEGFVSLSFEGESLVNIQPESRVQIVEFDCFDKESSCVVNLLSDEGQMSFNIKNAGFKKPPRFSIQTPYVSAAVRGTQFDVEVLEGSVLGVTEGAVQVVSGDLRSAVPVGKGVLAGEGQSIDKLYDLQSKPEINRFIRLSPEDIISWAAIETASAYRYVFAENETLSDVIARGTTNSTFVELLPQSDRFYLSTRAVDENGLKGFRTVLSVDRLSIDDSVEAPALDIELSEDQLKIVNTGDLTSEVHVGNQLEPVDELDQLLRFDAHDLAAGDTLELVVDKESDIYIVSRAVVGSSSVSPYGNIYEFKRSSK